jgi:hypothetical protein
VRVPDGTVKNIARVTLSFPDWKEGQLAPAVVEIPVGDLEPTAEPAERK